MNKKKNWLLLVLVLAMVVVVIITIKVFFFPKKAAVKTFNEKEYSIKLTEDFSKKELEGATYYYESTTAIAMIIKEKASELKDIGIQEKSSLDDYIQAIVKNNNLPQNTKINKKGNYRYISYENGDKKAGKYYFVAVTFRHGDEFWLMNFACRQTNDKQFKQQFLNWADSVKFK